MENKYSERLHNAMIEAAVCDYWEKVIADTDWSKNGEHSFSKRHMAKIKAVIRKQKWKATQRKVMRACSRAAVIVLILFSVTFATMMSSSALREEVYKIITQAREYFSRFASGEITAEQFNKIQTDEQIKRFEGTISSALEIVGLPQDTSFQIHIDGNLNIRLTGLNDTDTAKIWPYINHTGLADILVTAYATENKNQLYYVQSVKRNYDALAYDNSEDLYAVKREYRKIIREYYFAHHFESTEEMMEQERTIIYTNGKLIFAEE